MRRRTVWVVGAIWCLVCLSCNLPVAPGASKPDAARQTLEAYILATHTPEGAALATAQPVQTATLPSFLATEMSATASPLPPVEGAFSYTTQSGDTAEALAKRFGVSLDELSLPAQPSAAALVQEGIALTLPNRLPELPYRGRLLPDSEIVYSPTTVGFSVEEFVREAGGFLSTYQEQVEDEMLTGAQIIERVASTTSTNPRVLLAILEFRSGWVLGQPVDPNQTLYPIGFYVDRYSGLEREMTLVARFLTVGYYGWRLGDVTELEFSRARKVRLDPTLNAGSAAVQSVFSKLTGPESLYDLLYGPNGFAARYAVWMGDPWQRDAALGPLLPADLSQPPLELPFAAGFAWSFTGGAHIAWGIGSPAGAVDFAPSDETGCAASPRWVTASAPGRVVRSERGIVVLDLDMDGNEQTGWSLMYLHVATEGRAPLGEQLAADQPLGHPSCEGGVATGKHVHLTRKYNGEWIGITGPLPFVLSGWQVIAGSQPYRGALLKEGQVVTSRLDRASTSLITR